MNFSVFIIASAILNLAISAFVWAIIIDKIKKSQISLFKDEKEADKEMFGYVEGLVKELNCNAPKDKKFSAGITGEAITLYLEDKSLLKKENIVTIIIDDKAVHCGFNGFKEDISLSSDMYTNKLKAFARIRVNILHCIGQSGRAS